MNTTTTRPATVTRPTNAISKIADGMELYCGYVVKSLKGMQLPIEGQPNQKVLMDRGDWGLYDPKHDVWKASRATINGVEYIAPYRPAGGRKAALVVAEGVGVTHQVCGAGFFLPTAE